MSVFDYRSRGGVAGGKAKTRREKRAAAIDTQPTHWVRRPIGRCDLTRSAGRVVRKDVATRDVAYSHGSLDNALSRYY